MISFPALNATARLTGDLQTIPYEVDRGAAIATLLLKAIFISGGEGEHEERLAQEIEGIKQRREKEAGGSAFLVFEAEGDVEDFEIINDKEEADYVIALTESPKQEIGSRYENAINAIFAAFAIYSDTVSGIKKVANAITFFRGDGKPVLCYTLGGTANMHVASSLTSQAMELVKMNSGILSKHQALVDSTRLLSRSLAVNSDPLMSFLSVWSGLEIFINKNFKVYEKRVLDRLSAGNPPLVPPKVVERIQNVMSDKYRLADKFSVIAAELGDPDVDSDQAQFESYKIVRDKLLHGEEVSISSLPFVQTGKLLRKYLKLHLNASR